MRSKGLMDVKLAEALLLRSEYLQKIDSLQQRIIANLKVQEDEKPHEDPNALLAEVLKLNDELCLIIKKINKKNNEVKMENGQTISEALVDRDMLLKKRQSLSSIASNAGQRDFRLTHTEVKICATVDVGRIQKEIDSLSQQFRKLDTQIQGQNWIVDLD